MAVREYREAGVCRIVDDQSATLDGMHLRVTPVGTIDELMADASFYAYITSSQGAVLEVAGDGIRISPSAAGDGIGGGGDNKLRVNITKQAGKTITDTDKIMFEDASGALWRTTRLDVATGGPVPAYSFQGNVAAGSQAVKNLQAADIPLSALGTGSTVVGHTSGGALVRFDFETNATQLASVPSVSSVLITNSSGSDALIAGASPSEAGVMSVFLYETLAVLASQSYDLSVATTATTNTIVNAAGNNAVLSGATVNLAGLLTASDKSLLDSLSSNSTNLGASHTASSVIVTNTTGTDATINPVTSSASGVVTPAQKAGWDAGGSGGDGTTTLSITGHGLTAADMGKPILASTGAILDHTSASSYASGLLAEVIDANTVKMHQPGFAFTLPSDRFEGGYSPTTSGSYCFWDATLQVWVPDRPNDTAQSIPDMLECYQKSGALMYCRARDFGPVASGTITTTGGGGSGDPEILVGAGVPSDPPAAGLALALDTTGQEFYRANGAVWTLFNASKFAGLVTYGNAIGTVPIDMSTGLYNQQLLLVGNTTLTFTDPPKAGWITWQIEQDATGGFSVTWPANVKDSGSIVIKQGPGDITPIAIWFDGTDYHATTNPSYTYRQYTTGASSLDVTNADVVAVVFASGSTGITALTGGIDGQTVRLIIANDRGWIDGSSANFFTDNGQSFYPSTTGGSITFSRASGVWWEIARSVY